MAIDFPATTGQATDGSFAHTASGITWAWDGTTWKAQGVTSTYTLPTASATTLGGIKVGSGLTINAGVLATTTGSGGSQTLDQVLATGNTTTRDIDTTGKIKFSNNYADLTALPSASTYHGMFAHVHSVGAAYYAHAGAWVRLADYSHTHTTPSLDQVLTVGNTTTRDIITTGKILYSNNYANLGDLPSASTYHGMFAHVHGEGHGYYAHAGAWVQLLDTSSSINELSDVTISSPSTGQVLKYNGSAWVNDTDATGGGGGGSYTNSDVDTHLNTSSASSGEILSWNGSDYAWVADQTGGGGGGSSEPEITWTLGASGSSHYTFTGSGFTGAVNDPTLYLVRGQTYKFDNQSGGHPFQIQSTAGISGTPYTTGVTNSPANTGSALTFIVPMDAPDTLYYQCTQHPAMNGTINVLTQSSGGTGLGSRQTKSATTGSVANNTAVSLSITAFKSYALLSVKPSVASWVTLYCDDASRTADANRVQGADPAPDAGVIAEVITTTANEEIKMTPGVIGWNNDSTPSTTVYAKVVNLSGSGTTIDVELKVLQLEA